MPKRRSAVKRIRVDRKRSLRNRKVKRGLKAAIKSLQAEITASKISDANQDLKKVFSLLDKAAKKKIIHPKTADRRKSRLARSIARSAKADNKPL